MESCVRGKEAGETLGVDDCWMSADWRSCDRKEMQLLLGHTSCLSSYLKSLQFLSTALVQLLNCTNVCSVSPDVTRIRAVLKPGTFIK